MIYLLLTLFALLSILSHPTLIAGKTFPNLGFLAFISYIPLVWIAKTQSVKKLFYQGLFFGVLFNLGSLYWLYTALNSFGGLHPAISIFVQILLSFILSFYFILPWCLAKWVSEKSKIEFYFILPLFFIAAEWCRNRWPMGGFPWGQIGYSQARYLSLIQIADVFGVYGVTALVLWGNLWCLEIVKKIFPSPLRGEGRVRVIPSALKDHPLSDSLPSRERGVDTKLLFFPILLLCTFLYGKMQIQHYQSLEEKSPALPVAFIQGNIQQDEKWDTKEANRIVKLYQNYTQQAVDEGAQLVFWPETAYPFEIDLQTLKLDKKLDFQAALVLGALSSEKVISSAPWFKAVEIQYHNSSFLLENERLRSFYHKQKLVPYGEYVPLKEYFPFLDKLTQQVGNFYPGNKLSLLETQGAKMGSLICYEDIFPEVARGHSLAGANLLVNLTNDAWYGLSSALPQHINFSIFRAVENRRMLVRATNTGASALVHSWGALESELPYWTEAVGKGEVKLLEEKSFYTKFGDVFAYGCLILTGCFLLRSLFKRNL